jgi:hypothetical protein
LLLIKLSRLPFKKDIPVKTATNEKKSKPHFNGIMVHDITLQKKYLEGSATSMEKVHFWVLRSIFCE